MGLFATQPPPLAGATVSSIGEARGSRLMSNKAYGSLAGELNNSTYAALAVALLVGAAIVAGYANGAVNVKIGK